MSPTIIVLMLAAALFHATWNALVKASPDPLARLAAINLASGAVGAVAVCLVPLPAPVLWPVLALSVAVHVLYKFALSRAYSVGDLGAVYPMARGVAPLAALGLAFIVVGEAPSGPAVAGVVAISAALVLLTWGEAGGAAVGRRAMALAVATGAAIGVYTVIDGYGARLASHWTLFAAWLFLLDSSAFVLSARLSRGPGLWRAIVEGRSAALVSGAVAIASYGVFLWALSLGAMGVVAALRETSVVFAALIGVLMLREKITWARGGAVALISVGILLVAARG